MPNAKVSDGSAQLTRGKLLDIHLAHRRGSDGQPAARVTTFASLCEAGGLCSGLLDRRRLLSLRRRDFLPRRRAPSLPWRADEDHVAVGTPSGRIE